MPMRGSLRSRINSATSRWIWSATRKPRLGIDGLCRMGFPSAQTRTPPFFGGRGSGESRYRLQRPGDFLDLEELEQVAFLDVVVVFQLDAALEAGGDLADVVLHASHGLDLAGVDDDVLAQQAEARAAAPIFDATNTVRISAVPIVSSRCSGASMPVIAALISSTAS